MTIRGLPKAIGTLLLLFVCVYGPAFAVIGHFKPAMSVAVPLVILMSLAVAVALIFALSRRSNGIAEFGFRFCRVRYVVAAVGLGVPFGWALCLIVDRFSSGAPMPEMSLPFWMQIGYFVVGAAIQEEVIFRGLLQSTFARQFPASLSIFGASASYAVVAVALLFGLIHLEVNPVTAAAAFLLGLLSGELRRRSGSLLPAILVHAIFNALSALV